METEARTVTCDLCKQTYTVGEWPWCPHGSAKHFGEDPLEPYVDENLGHEPVEITSRAQRRRIMSQRKLEYANIKKTRGFTYVDLGGR